MGHNLDHWKTLLDLYGADFTRWPEMPSAQDQKRIREMDAYQRAQFVDAHLKNADFPAMSNDLFDKTMQQIQTQRQPVMWVILRKKAALFAYFAVLGLGLASGTHLGTTTSASSADYRYYELGPVAYNYAGTYEGGSYASQ